jgi:hypothetical protein
MGFMIILIIILSLIYFTFYTNPSVDDLNIQNFSDIYKKPIFHLFFILILLYFLNLKKTQTI